MLLDCWDYPQPFLLPIEVKAEHIDGLGHVNNTQYVTWMENCAWQHSEHLQLDLAQYRALDRAMVITRHEIDYLGSAFLHEALLMATWVGKIEKSLTMKRYFQLYRPKDQTTLLRASTQFACIALSTGRAKRMPELFVNGYGQAINKVDF